MQFPGDEEGAPVDILSNVCQWHIQELPGAGESGSDGLEGRPVDLHRVLLRLFESKILLHGFLTGEIFLELYVLCFYFIEVRRFLFFTQQGAGNGNTT